MMDISRFNEVLWHMDGSSYMYSMTQPHDAQTVVFADSHAELVWYLVTGRIVEVLEGPVSELERHLLALTSATVLRNRLVDQTSAVKGEAPRVLMATDYAPFTDLTAPTGENIYWLNAASDSELIESLEQVGLIKINVEEGDEWAQAPSDGPIVNDPWSNPLLYEDGEWDWDWFNNQ